MSHAKAKLTPLGRRLLVERILTEGWPAAAAAESMGVSAQTAYKWLRRFRQGGLAALEDRSSRPHRSPRMSSERLIAQVRQLRLARRLGPHRIAYALGVARSTVYGILARLGLNRLDAIDRVSRKVVRYQREQAGELIHLDIKKFARIERIGHRIHGDRSKTVDGAGWEYLHVCIDDASRVSYAEVLSNERGVTCAAFLERAAAWFRRCGVVVEGVMTDNGSGYVSKVFAAALRRIGARHLRTRPYTPRTNGKAERFIQTCKREWAYARPYRSSQERIDALSDFLCHYNCHRRHWGIGRITPQLRLSQIVNNLSGCYS